MKLLNLVVAEVELLELGEHEEEPGGEFGESVTGQGENLELEEVAKGTAVHGVDAVVVQPELDEVGQAAEVVVEHGREVVPPEVEHLEGLHPPEGVHPDGRDVRVRDVQLLQPLELLEDRTDRQRVRVPRGG